MTGCVGDFKSVGDFRKLRRLTSSPSDYARIAKQFGIAMTKAAVVGSGLTIENYAASLVARETTGARSAWVLTIFICFQS